MLKLRTVYPYGLNDRVGDEFKNEENEKLIASQFPKLDRQFVRRTKGSGKGKQPFSANAFVHGLQHMLQNEIKEGMNFVRHTLASLRKSTLKQIVVLVNDFILEDDNTIYLQWYLAVIDTIESKIYKPPPLKPSKQKPSSIIKIQFLNKGIEMINVPRLLHSPSLASTFPKQAGCYKAPTVVYKLEDTIRSSIFNFNHFVKTLDLDKFMEDNTILPCNCGKSPFIDNHHNHVITGDLRIVPNNKLRKLFVKGPKHREPVTIDFLKSKEEIIEGMEVVINRWSDTSGVDEVVFEDWKHEFHRLLDDRISNITRNIKIQKTLPSLKQYHVKNTLKELQKNYIITPIDKASTKHQVTLHLFVRDFTQKYSFKS